MMTTENHHTPLSTRGDSAPEVAATSIGDPKAFQPFGDHVVLLIAEYADGTFQAFVPSSGRSKKCATYGLVSLRPRKIVDLESTGWACWQVNATTWKCSRVVCGMRIVTTVTV
jgi:hypothetical protein